MAEYAHLSAVDPELVSLLAAAGSSFPAPTADSIQQIRAAFAEAAGYEMLKKKLEPLLPPSSDYTIADHDIDVGGGVTVKARSVVPTTRDGEHGTFPTLPLANLLPSKITGFAVGELHEDDYKLKIASVNVRVTVVNCEYRCVKAMHTLLSMSSDSTLAIGSLAPEHPFPTAVDDTYAALKFVASHPEKFSASLKKGFIVGGTSAGGNLSAVLSHLARDDPFFKHKPLTGQLLHIPTLIHRDAIPEKSSLLSFEQNKDAPVLNKEQIIAFIDLYNPSPTDTRMSPLLLDSHKGLPASYFQIYRIDPLRDESLLYEKVLKEERTADFRTLNSYPGVPHAFEAIFFDIKQAARFRKDLHVGLKWLLGQTKA
ncbi:hypothetical protein V5O48_016816 [Marasmius crinis-equi]|uniref:Alpha/beta hydrolase fold-3 domain-containing protein n=1 Tax=Marasmius crinis-equi TaxID=585013 RepID=A0ABR3EQY1_9AGAR